jgi:hypothetical protein
MMAMEAIHSVAPAEAGAAMLQRESRAASGQNRGGSSPGRSLSMRGMLNPVLLRRGDVE